MRIVWIRSFFYVCDLKECIDNVNIKRYIMNIKISEHAAKRMAERNISEGVVRKAFDSEDWEEVLMSKFDPTAMIAVKTIDEVRWCFVFNVETETLITCYPRR